MATKMKFNMIEVGQEVPELKITYTPEKNKYYNRVVKEINPLHFNLNYAKSLGYRNIVIAGVFTYSFFIKIVKDWLGESGLIRDLEIFFKNPAHENDVVIHKGKVIDKHIKDNKKLIKCEIWSEDKDGVQLANAKLNIEIK